MKIAFLSGLVIIIAGQLLAAPTIRGVNAVTEGDALVYSDSNNQNVLWVTPPSTGSLKLVSENGLFVDNNICSEIASVSKRRVAFEKQIVATTKKAFDALDRQDTGDDSVTDSYIASLWSRVDDFTTRKKAIKFDNSAYQSGGWYSYVAKSGQKALMDTVRQKNTSATVQPIQAKVTSIAFSLRKNGVLEVKNDIVLDYGIPDTGELASPVEALQIDVNVTKLGACYLAFPEIMSTSAEPFKPSFIVNYEYPFLFAQKVTASYNLRKVYQRIETTKTKKRFFSSKTYVSVMESNELSSDLNVKVISDLPLGPLKQQLERQAREIVLSVAISEMVGRMKTAGHIPDSGAAIAASELAKNCGPNLYCQGVGAALRVLDSSFGGNSQTSNLTQILDHKVSYTNDTGETLPVKRSLSYVVQ
jgi:hypothetical protein